MPRRATASITTLRGTISACQKSSSSTSATSSSAKRFSSAWRRRCGRCARRWARAARRRSGAVIIGIGSDLCDIRRIEETLGRFGERFVARCFTEIERRRSDRRAEPRGLLRQAVRGQGSLRQGARHGHAPRRLLARHGRRQPADRQADDAFDRRRRGAARGDHAAGRASLIHLTITDEDPLAQAFVVIEARPTA